jgi:hypothetical protein
MKVLMQTADATISVRTFPNLILRTLGQTSQAMYTGKVYRKQVLVATRLSQCKQDGQRCSGVAYSKTQNMYLTRRFLLSKHKMALQYTRECNFIYAWKKSTAFPAPILTKLTNAQRRYMQISYSEFHLSRTINVESVDKN